MVRNYSYSLRNNPQEDSSHLFRDGNLKSRIEAVLCDVIPRYFEVILRERKAATIIRNYYILRGGAVG